PTIRPRCSSHRAVSPRLHAGFCVRSKSKPFSMSWIFANNSSCGWLYSPECGPVEILALQWKHVAADHVAVVQRLYRGQLDRPKNERSQRTVALSSTTRTLLQQWRPPVTDPEAWIFPSARTTTPLGRDNTWRRLIAPKLKPIGFDWATFQVMRRTHASLCRQAGIDPKLVADQLGHGLGVNLDVYTVADLDQRQQAGQTLGATIIRPQQR